MADINRKLRDAWIKGMETIGSTASGIASNAKFKVDEMNLINNRKELLASLAQRSYELFKEGEHFPAEIEEILHSIIELDESIRAIRADHLDRVAPGVVKMPAEAIDEAADELGNTIEAVGQTVDEVVSTAADFVAEELSAPSSQDDEQP